MEPILAVTTKITPLLENYVNSIKAPEGWTKYTMRHRYFRWESWVTPEQLENLAKTDGEDLGFITVVLLKPDDITITATLSVDKAVDYQSKSKKKKAFVGGGGHTHFKTDKGWRSFDRIGVSDSFYVNDWENGTQEFGPLFEDEVKQVQEWREKDKDRIDVPDIGYRISPATKEAHSKTLKNGQYVQFRPSGFGTGYNLRAKPMIGYSIKRGSNALAKFYDVPAIWIQSVECD